MEDRAVCLEEMTAVPSLGFYGVYDGHNGHAAADFLSAKLHEAVASALQTW